MNYYFRLIFSRSSWNFVSICACAQKILPEPYQQSCQWALIANPGSYFYRLTAKLLQNFCFGFWSVFIVSCLCWLVVTWRVAGHSSTFEYLLQQGVNFHGSLYAQVFVLSSTWVSAVLSVLQRSITLLLQFEWSLTLPKPRELHLSRLLSSIVDSEHLNAVLDDEEKLVGQEDFVQQLKETVPKASEPKVSEKDDQRVRVVKEMDLKFIGLKDSNESLEPETKNNAKKDCKDKMRHEQWKHEVRPDSVRPEEFEEKFGPEIAALLLTGRYSNGDAKAKILRYNSRKKRG